MRTPVRIRNEPGADGPRPRGRPCEVSAASDLYGATSPEYNAVNATWKAVNVK